MPLDVTLHLAGHHHVTGMSPLLESALFAPAFDAGTSCFARCRHACMNILLFPTKRAKTGARIVGMPLTCLFGTSGM